jgi:hypothetical protein
VLLAVRALAREDSLLKPATVGQVRRCPSSGIGSGVRMSSTEEILYTEAVRAIRQQEASVDELRSRAGVVLGATVLVTSFLGAHALAGHRDLGGWGGAAAATSALSALFALAILMPTRGWIFANDVLVMLEDHSKAPATPETAYSFIADCLGKHRQKNEGRLDRLYWALRLAIVLLVVAVGAWLMQLGGR